MGMAKKYGEEMGHFDDNYDLTEQLKKEIDVLSRLLDESYLNHTGQERLSREWFSEVRSALHYEDREKWV